MNGGGSREVDVSAKVRLETKNDLSWGLSKGHVVGFSTQIVTFLWMHHSHTSIASLETGREWVPPIRFRKIVAVICPCGGGLTEVLGWVRSSVTERLQGAPDN